MTQVFRRDSVTWLAYALLAFYGYFLNVLGPITPFLQGELKLSYTVASLHFTAFGIGMLLAGAGGHLVVERAGRERSLWVGAAGLSAGVALLVLGRNPVLTVAACFVMGTVGSLILVLVPAVLSDRHGEQRAVALAEGNTLASLVAALAALMVGWFAASAGGWRLALVLVALTPVLLWPGLGRGRPGRDAPRAGKGGPEQAGRGLPGRFWIYWAALVLAVSVEFCMIFWSATYLERGLGVTRAAAAQAVSLFLGGMIVGRLAGSRMAQRMPADRVASVSVVLAGAGFLVFWLAGSAGLALAGLLITGLGVANLYPMILSLGMGAAEGNTVQAGARSTLASGSAILALPLALGRLADAFGIHAAYSIVMLLLAGTFLIIVVAALGAWQPTEAVR